MTVPKQTGFYWARWMMPSDEEEKGPHDYTPGPYEPVELVDRDDDGKFTVEMLGSTPDQPPENFFWGPRIEPPQRVTKDVEQGEEKNRRAARNYYSMTPDQREQFLIDQKRKT